MQLMDVGPRQFHKVIAGASSTFTPLYDRAAIVRRILLDIPSATDTWTISVKGREVGRFRQDSLGNQQFLGGSAASFPKTLDLFWYCKYYLGFDLIYPLPLGQTITVSSVGGATADITIEYTEHTPGDVQVGLLNHPDGTHFVCPVALVPPNNVTHASGTNEDDFSSQIGMNWLPTLTGAQQLPAGFRLGILSMFLEGSGVNTFSGSANHQSVTDHIALIRNGTRLFTRDANDGIPLIGPASAAGSANTVYGALNTPLPAFMLTEEPQWPPLVQPLTLNPGDQYHFYFGTAGDSTGGADYSHTYTALILDVTAPPMQG